MNDSPVDFLTPDQIAVLTKLAEAENTRLEEAASSVTNQAFNLGCLVGVLPGGIILLVVFLVTDFSIIGVAISLVLILIGLIAFANLAAMLARRNTIRRVYREQSAGKIEQILQETGLTRDQFNKVAHQVLPPQAALNNVLPAAYPPSTHLKEFRLVKRVIKDD